MFVTRCEKCYDDLLEALIKLSETLQKTSRKTCTQSSMQQIHFIYENLGTDLSSS